MKENEAKQFQLLIRVAMNFSLIAADKLTDNEKKILDTGVDEIIKVVKTTSRLVEFVLDSIRVYSEEEQAFQKISNLITMAALALKKIEKKNG